MAVLGVINQVFRADRLTAIEIFVEAARAGSVSAVAERFEMTPAMIGKYIKWQEARVGTRRPNRNTRCRSLPQHYRALDMPA